MANPVIVALPVSAWTKVATSVTAGTIYTKQTTVKLSQTRRMTGNAAPTDQSDAVRAFVDGGSETISASAPIDVYLYNHNATKAGSVRVDL